MKANARARDDAVSDVLGNILMVGITVGMMVGLSVMVLNFGGPPDRVHADFRVDLSPGGAFWGDGNEEIQVRHVGGEAVPRDETRIVVAINGSLTSYAGAQLDQGFADGEFRLGDRWNLTVLVPGSAIVEVSIVQTSANQVIASNFLSADTSIAQSGNNSITYVAAGGAARGTLASFNNAKSASDGGAVATISESSVPGGIQTSRLNGAVNNAVGVAGPAAVLTSNDGRASFKDSGHQVTVDSFVIPAGMASISSVKIGIEGLKGGGGGANGDPQLQLSYSGVPLAPGSSKTVTMSSGTDISYLHDITADKAVWTRSDLEAIKVQANRLNPDANARDADIDHIFVEVTYNEAPTTDASVQFDFVGVPSGSLHELQIRYARSGDTFAVEVHNGATWVQRGTLTASTMSLFTYTLSNPEYKGGSPQIRFIDLDSGAAAGVLEIDYARIQSQ